MPQPEGPVVVSAHDGCRRVVAGVNAVGQAAGVVLGMALTQAQALVPGLTIFAHEPDGDAAALSAVALACLRYAPLVAVDPPGGIWIDVTGCTALAGGEKVLLAGLLAWLDRSGFTARAAIAETPAAAHAVARFGRANGTVVPHGEADAALASLPVRALRLPEEICAGLVRLGFDQVGQLVAIPRAPLIRRFGTALALRLDQAQGAQFETIRPLTPPEAIERRLAFVEPIGTADAFGMAIDRLLRFVCARLDRVALGARRLDLLFERIDGSVQAIRIGTARASRDAAHLARLLRERLEQVDPGEGVEAMRLVAVSTEALTHTQLESDSGAQGARGADIAGLVDRLANRLGPDRIYRVEPAESDVPERSVHRVPPLSPPSVRSWPVTLPRPARLLSPPQHITAIAPLPDRPPAAFTWRRHAHRVRRADGPERIFGEWWKRDGEVLAVRDYFAVENEDGRRFWLFRHGDGEDPETGDLSWFLHGLF